MTERTFYVRVEDYNQLRADILMCSKDIIGVLKDYGRINQIRTEKIEKIIELKKAIAEIKNLNNYLSQKIPIGKISTKREPSARNVRRAVRGAPAEQEEPNPEINLLEEELKEIEERLNKLNA